MTLGNSKPKHFWHYPQFAKYLMIGVYTGILLSAVVFLSRVRESWSRRTCGFMTGWVSDGQVTPVTVPSRQLVEHHQ